MAAGIRTNELRKVYNTAPPLAAGGGGFAFAEKRSKGKQPKPEIVALNGISLDIRPGEIFCLLGPNGAGKSTTVGVLTTRVKPTAGQARIGDHDVWKEQAAVKRLIGVVAQRPNLDFSLTAREILTFHGAYFGLSSHERNNRAASLLERSQTPLTDHVDQIVRGFSANGGMMQRLSIARAMLRMMLRSPVLFLDEPSAGLDPQTRLLLWEIIREYNSSGKTVLLTTHNMEEADALCQRLAIVDHGRIIALGYTDRVEGFEAAGRAYPPASALRPTLTGIVAALPGAVWRARSARNGKQWRGSLRRPRRLARFGSCESRARRKHRIVLRTHLRAQSRKSFSAPHRQELARMNYKAFMAMLARDVRVARRNIVALLFQTFLQPLMFVFIFGRVMVGSGYMRAYLTEPAAPGHRVRKTGIGTGDLSCRSYCRSSKSFSSRAKSRTGLLAPMDISWVAIEKVVAGTLQALAAGLMVIPFAWLLLRPGVDLSLHRPILFAIVALLGNALFSACGSLCAQLAEKPVDKRTSA